MRFAGRAAVTASAALAAVPLFSAVAGGGGQDSRNSIVTEATFTSLFAIRGTGCGSPTTGQLPLPEGVTDARVVQPTVGAQNGGARVTTVEVRDATIFITAVGDGPEVCDPAAEPTAPSARPWQGRFQVEARYPDRVQVRLWVQKADGTQSAKTAVRPRTVRNGTETLTRTSWSKFGATKAVGSGILKPHGSGARCPARVCPWWGSRFKVEASEPSRCDDLPGVVYYGRITFITTKKVGRIDRGKTWLSTEPRCKSGRPAPARLGP